MNALPYYKNNIVWFLGPAASGKSTAIEYLQSLALEHMIHIDVISDLTMLIQLIREDEKQTYHTRVSDDQFIITNEDVYDEAMVRVCRDLERKKDAPLVGVELSCGIGESDRLSFQRRFFMIPDFLLSRSFFIFIKNSERRRSYLNRKRKGVSHTPLTVYKKYFLYDDIENTLQSSKCRWYIAKNISSVQTLTAQLHTIFIHERCSK